MIPLFDETFLRAQWDADFRVFKDGPDWLWSEVGTPTTWKQSPEAPAGLSARELTAWAKARHAEALQARQDELDALLQPGVALSVENTADELNLIIGGREALRIVPRSSIPLLAASIESHQNHSMSRSEPET